MNLNPNEAPDGYYAVLKPAWTPNSGNLCSQCDWRPTCNDPKTDFTAPGNRCMASTVVVLRTGKEFKRQDGCSVLFKKKP